MNYKLEIRNIFHSSSSLILTMEYDLHCNTDCLKKVVEYIKKYPLFQIKYSSIEQLIVRPNCPDKEFENIRDSIGLKSINIKTEFDNDIEKINNYIITTIDTILKLYQRFPILLPVRGSFEFVSCLNSIKFEKESIIVNEVKLTDIDCHNIKISYCNNAIRKLIPFENLAKIDQSNKFGIGQIDFHTSYDEKPLTEQKLIHILAENSFSGVYRSFTPSFNSKVKYYHYKYGSLMMCEDNLNYEWRTNLFHLINHMNMEDMLFHPVIFCIIAKYCSKFTMQNVLYENNEIIVNINLLKQDNSSGCVEQKLKLILKYLKQGGNFTQYHRSFKRIPTPISWFNNQTLELTDVDGSKIFITLKEIFDNESKIIENLENILNYKLRIIGDAIMSIKFKSTDIKKDLEFLSNIFGEN